MFALIVCVLIPRFELAVAAGGREALAAGPVALAPEAGREQLIGEASAAAEAHGVKAGLRLGEALARCPTLQLVTPDPAGVADEWDRLVAALEGIGAAVEPGRPGLAWFDSRGLRKLYGGARGGGDRGGAERAGHPGAPGSGAVALRRPRGGVARPRVRRPELAPAGRTWPPTSRRCPSDLLGYAPGDGGAAGDARALRDPHARASSPPCRARALADRFGAAGPLARDLAKGRDAPLQAPPPRRAARGAARAARVGVRTSSSSARSAC